MNVTPPQPQVQDEMLKRLVALHQHWLSDPTTQAYVTILQKRIDQYEKSLLEHILTKSDKEFEDKSRSAITTGKAFLKLLTQSDLFVSHQIQRPSELTKNQPQ